MLLCLHQNLDLAVPLNAACFAAACCAFWGQCRLGKLLPDRLVGFPPHFPLRSHVKPPSTAEGSRVVHLPRTKTMHSAGGSLFLCHQDGALDAIDALQNHLSVNSLTPSDLLFSFHSPSGAQILSKSHFLCRVSCILDAAGFAHISGHSFRISGTTHLLLSGVQVPPNVVKVMGHWSSEAFLCYWRNMEVLAPLHAEFTNTAP